MGDEQRKPAIQSSKEIQISPEIPKLDIGTATEKAPRDSHPINEDTFAVGEGFFAIADGMGGTENGEIASQAAVENITRRDLPNLIKQITRHELLQKEETKQILENSFRRAHNAVVFKTEEDNYEEKVPPGTTLTAAVILKNTGEGHTLAFGSVGDTSIGIYNSETQKINIITTKHFDALAKEYSDKKTRARAQDMLDRAANPKRGLPEKLYKNVYLKDHEISAYLGGKEAFKFEPRVHAWKLDPGERVIAFTDGMETLTLGEMEQILTKEKDNATAAEKLLALASKKDADPNHPRRKLDDKTVLVIGVK